MLLHTFVQTAPKNVSNLLEFTPNLEAEVQPDVEPQHIVELEVQPTANRELTLERGVHPNTELEMGPNPDLSDCPQTRAVRRSRTFYTFLLLVSY